MDLIFEKSRPGRGSQLLRPLDVPEVALEPGLERQEALPLPELSQITLARHYGALARRAFGVQDGFYPLGSCTMKYNPRLHEAVAALPEFTDIHPLQPAGLAQGCLEVLEEAGRYLCELTAMDQMTFQPAAGAHGELTGMLMIKAYHLKQGQAQRRKILVPDSAHGTNPASAVMAGFEVVNVPSTPEGMVDVAVLESLLGEDTAGLMLTNPNTLGLFDQNILRITQLVHDAGGLNYYDGANLNAIMGLVRPGDMGFDVIHLNLHKTFATPHGGGGPGSGPVGCKAFLAPYLPGEIVTSGAMCAPDSLSEMDLVRQALMDKLELEPEGPETEAAQSLLAQIQQAAGSDAVMQEPSSESIGRVRAFYGNFLVVVKALTYLKTLGATGIQESARQAVLNANYLLHQLKDQYELPYGEVCMHEFVLSLEGLRKTTGVKALDMAKALLDEGMHPPTMYFPLIVPEALMFEPTETESPETLDQAAEVMRKLYRLANEAPERLKEAPFTTPIGRVDEVGAARHPHLRYRES